MPQIQEAIFKKCKELEDCRFAPYEGDTVFIINDSILILNGEIIDDFDCEYYKEVFNIIKVIE